MLHKSYSRVLSMLAVFVAGAFLVTPGAASATTYTYEVGENQTWSDTSTTVSTVQYTTVRAYVPGDRSINYRTVPIYTSLTTSGANALGDVVGYKYNTYGTSPAFVDPYDGSKYYLNYPTYQLMSTKLYQVNDQRLAIGTYYTTGASSHPFIYDLIHKKYTVLRDMNPDLKTLNDINNSGQIVGKTVDYNGAISEGYVYDCQNGQITVDVPTSVATYPQKIDDAGNIYGSFVSPDMVETYFIARPDTPTNINCSLVGRDDIFEPLVFAGGVSFEMSGDSALATSIADFSGDGTTDILMDHGGKVILYLGEKDFDKKIKYSGESFNTIFNTEFPEVIVPVQGNDVNNDGFDDSIVNKYSSIEINLGKGDGSFYYVPQTVSATTLADLNNDGLLDTISVNGAYVTVRYQQAPVAPAPAPEPTPEPTEPVVTEPVVTEPVVTEPVVDPVVTEPVVDPVVVEPTPVVEPAPTDSLEQPYLNTIEADFPGATVLKLSIDEETLGAEFKIEYNGEKIEGWMSEEYVITEFYN